MHDEQGKVLMWVGSDTDIEGVKQTAEEKRILLESERIARKEVEQASQIKDEFLANLSHELRTPLNAIHGWSQLLLHENKKAEDLQSGLEIIYHNARAQKRLIEDLLDMTSIISGKIRLNIQQLNLARIAETAIASLRPSAENKEIRLQKKLDPVAGPVSGDFDRVQQIVCNLLSNAIKYTPKGGNIMVSVERVASHLELIVSDSGSGINPEFLPFIFDRFRQADSSSTRHYGGLGIGLAIVKQLVELHGGTVQAKSPGEGQGASFTVSIPVSHS